MNEIPLGTDAKGVYYWLVQTKQGVKVMARDRKGNVKGAEHVPTELLSGGLRLQDLTTRAQTLCDSLYESDDFYSMAKEVLKLDTAIRAELGLDRAPNIRDTYKAALEKVRTVAMHLLGIAITKGIANETGCGDMEKMLRCHKSLLALTDNLKGFSPPLDPDLIQKYLAFLSGIRDKIIDWVDIPLSPDEKVQIREILKQYIRLVGVLAQRNNAVNQHQVEYRWVKEYIENGGDINQIPL
jgi:hypothetical protein